MASPEVWADAQARVAAVATALGLTVNYPNAETQEPELGDDGVLPSFLAIEIEADGAAPYELGNSIWLEDGRLWVHVLIPTGSGITDGLAIRKAVANAFRATPNSGAILWDAFSFPPGGRDESSGNWFRLSLGISYRFTDR